MKVKTVADDAATTFHIQLWKGITTCASATTKLLYYALQIRDWCGGDVTPVTSTYVTTQGVVGAGNMLRDKQVFLRTVKRVT